MRALIIATFLCSVSAARADGPSDPARATELASSVHAELSCGNCHGEHGSPVEACARCHGDAAKAMTLGAHARQQLSCVDCHGSHDVRASSAPGSRTDPKAISSLCGGCHDLVARAASSSAHAQAIEAGVSRAPTCATCHGAHATVAAVPISTCQSCHAAAAADQTRGAHATQLGCKDCHAVHAEPAGLAVDGARTYAGSLARCMKCHPRAADDHASGPHGVAGRLGDPSAPACITCHRAHAVIDGRSADSLLSSTRRGEVCGGCHRGAPPAFASGAYHHDASFTGHRIVDWVRTMYTMMIVLVIAGMLAHNGIDFRRRWLDRKRHARRPDDAQRVARFTRLERVQHWTLATSFLTLLATGFAFRFGWRPPGVDAATWPAWRGGLHRGAALVFMSIAVVHVTWLFLSRRGRMNAAALRPHIRSIKDVFCVAACCFRFGPPSMNDWRALIGTLSYNLGRTPERPAQGRFTYAEKMEYYALVWGGIVMVTTGLGLWFVVPVLTRAPAWVAHLIDVIHLYEATLAGLAIVVWHFYFTMFRPEVFPISRAMITGTIPQDEAEEEHALESGARGDACTACGKSAVDCACTRRDAKR